MDIAKTNDIQNTENCWRTVKNNQFAFFP